MSTRSALIVAAGLVTSLAITVPPASGLVAHPPGRAAGGRGTHLVARRFSSLVYVKHGDIYVAHPNGRHRRLVRRGTYYWPSMDDHGVIAAEGPDGHTAPDGSAGYSIYRFGQRGKKLSRESTPADFSTLSCPTYPPNHISLSPSGKKVAYDFILCGSETTTVWSPARRMSFRGEGAGQEGWASPVWLSNKKLLVTHVGVRVAGGREAGVVRTRDGGNSVRDWFDADGWATGFTSTATRNGKKVAILEDDAANYFDGEPRHVRLVLGVAAGPRRPVTVRCRVRLSRRQYSRGWHGVSNAALSFKTDGSALVWDGRSGLFHANTRRLSRCGTLKPHLLLKHAHDGFFSPATDHR